VREYHLLEAAAVGVSLAIGMLAREYARAYTADRVGDPNPRRWGWLGPDPRVWIDPFGTVILPVLLMILWAAGFALPPFAYAKPLPFDPSSLRHGRRDVVLVSVAGPIANIVLAVLGGLLLRAGVAGASAELCTVLRAFVLTQLTLAVFHLLPIPGLDGARMLALVMSPRAREVYRNLDQYLILFVLLIFFLLGGIALSIVEVLRDALLDVVVGGSGC
jgi:Zn-dependent protease